MDHKKLIRSASLIHFITNQTECYIKIKNIITNEYLYIDTTKQLENEIEKKAIGTKDGTIFILKPTYTISKCIFSLLPNQDDTKEKYYLMATHDSAIIEKTNNEMNDIYFYLDGTIDKTYICACQNDKNMYGENGRYLYMTENNNIFCNGDPSISSSLWRIEKLNEYQLCKDVRADYENEYNVIDKESKKNINMLFSNVINYFTIFNEQSKLFLNISLNRENSFEHELFGYHEKMNFMLRPVPNENCVYISYYYRNKYINLFTLPKCSEVYAGAPDCDWAKFYIVKKNNQYLFQIFHKESDQNGNYGKFLCMKNENDKYIICCDGCCNGDNTKWSLNYDMKKL